MKAMRFPQELRHPGLFAVDGVIIGEQSAANKTQGQSGF